MAMQRALLQDGWGTAGGGCTTAKSVLTRPSLVWSGQSGQSARIENRSGTARYGGGASLFGAVGSVGAVRCGRCSARRCSACRCSARLAPACGAGWNDADWKGHAARDRIGAALTERRAEDYSARRSGAAAAPGGRRSRFSNTLRRIRTEACFIDLGGCAWLRVAADGRASWPRRRLGATVS